MSDNQLKHVVRAYEESLVKRESCPEGRITDTYVVKSVSLKESYYGVTEKMVLEHKTGYRVYVTVPSRINVQSGDTITLTMTVTVSDNDNRFGFGKRPSKAKLH